MCITEYNEELHEKTLREEGRDAELVKLILNMHKDGLSEDRISKIAQVTVEQVREILMGKSIALR